MRITKTIHSVDVAPGHVVAGFQVRGSGVLLGLMWFGDGVWNWRAEGSPYFGTRATMGAAITVLVDTYQVRTSGRTLPRTVVTDGDDMPRRTPARPVAAAPAPTMPRPAPTPRPAAVQTIVWPDAPTDGEGLSAALGAALNRAGRKR